MAGYDGLGSLFCMNSLSTLMLDGVTKVTSCDFVAVAIVSVQLVIANP